MIIANRRYADKKMLQCLFNVVDLIVFGILASAGFIVIALIEAFYPSVDGVVSVSVTFIRRRYSIFSLSSMLL
jgi:hypothetical protein